MTTETSYTQARANFAKLCDRVVEDLDVVIIRRRGRKDVALVSASEWSSMLETAHLLRSPRNRERLLRSLSRARRRVGKPQTVEQLRREVGFERET